MQTIIAKSRLGITDDNISDILSGECLSTKFRQTGRKGSISLDRYLPINQKPLAILQGKEYDDMTDDEKKEVEAYKVSQKIRQTLVSFIPKNLIKEIEAIEQQNVRKYRELCLSSDIMTEAQYNIFEKFLQKQEQKKEVVIDKIVKGWDNIIDNFINDVEVKYPYIGKQEIQDVATKKLGTGQDFKNSYKTILQFMPLPNTMSVQLLPTSLKDTALKNVNEQAEQEILDAIGTNINNLYAAINKVLLSNNNIASAGGTGQVAPKTKGTLINALDIAIANLSFLKIDDIDLLLSDIRGTLNTKDDKKLVQESEQYLYRIYNLMEENVLLDYLELEDSIIPEVMLSNQNIVAGSANNTNSNSTVTNNNSAPIPCENITDEEYNEFLSLI